MKRSLRILLLEDSPYDAELVEHALRGLGIDHQTLRVQTRATYRDALDRFAPDLILADFQLPEYDGMQALAELRGRDSDLPFIFVTGAMGEEVAVSMLQQGADDYILKDRLARLPSAVRRALDETERNRALKASEEKYRLLVEHQTDLIVKLDAQGRFEFVSPSYCTLFGKSEAELLGSSFMPMVHEDDREATFRVMEALRRPPHTAYIEQRALTANGWRWLGWMDSALLSEAGDVVSIIAVGRDIDQRKQSEEQLRLYERVIANTRDMMSFVDRDYTYRIVNDAYGRNFNRPRDAVIGSKVAELVGEDAFGEVVKPQLDRCLQGNEVQYQHIFRLADGPHYMDVQYSPYREADGSLSGVVVSARDITSIHKAETLLSLQARRAEALLELPRLGEGMDETGLMQLGQELAEDLTGSSISFIHFVSDDEQSIELVTWSRRTLATYCRAVHDKHYPVRDAGIWAEALRRREPVIFNDYPGYPHKHGLPEGHAELKRLISVPVIENGRVVMLAGVGNRDDNYSNLDVETVQLFANEIWRIVQRLRALERIAFTSRVLARSLNEIYIFDSGTLRFVDVNQGAQQNLGYTMDELKRLTPLDIQTGVTPESFTGMLEPLRSGAERKIVLTPRHRRKDGSHYPVEAHLQLIEDRPPVFVSIVLDISKREAIESERHKLAQAVEQSPESIVITDRGGAIEYVNESFVRTSGYHREELMGQNPRILKSGKTPRRAYEAMWDAVTHGQPWKGDFWNRRKDGSEYVEFAHVAPIRDADGHITHYLAVKEDITEKKQLAKELDRHRLHLEELVQSRTVELSAAREQAERLARVKSEFLANMSHEIRTPLNAVLGFAQVGVRDSAGRKARETFGHILDSGRLLKGIVDDILDYSKIEAGKLAIEPDTVPLRQLVESSAQMARSRIREEGVELCVDLDQGLPATCRGDRLRMSQILMNLLSNAVKFTQQGQITLTAARDGEQLLFQVEDTGIGMAPELVERLFNPFEQADGSITRKYGGTGLGLTITKRLVDLMEGTLAVWSEPGRGSRFQVRVPLEEPAGLACDEASAEQEAATLTAGGRLNGLSILVAEDNEVNRLVLADMLSTEGCRLVQVGDGAEAVQQVREMGVGPFDLVLMDIQMPVMDGYQATREIVRLAPGLPVIGLTAHALTEERNKCLAAGMVEHVAKPIDLGALLETILHTLHPDSAAAVAAAPEASPFSQRPAPGAVDWAGLHRQYQDRPGFLRRLLSTIHHSCEATPARLRELAGRGDFDQLAVTAHGLKGMASGVLPVALRERAALMERLARERSAEALASATLLAAEVEQLLGELRGRLHALEAETADGAEVESGGGEADVSVLLSDLEALLEQDDASVIERHDGARALLLRALGPEADRLARQIQDFDFDNALSTLRRLAPRPGGGEKP
jgi:two-component system sensor histidine kinase/response regulator